MRRAAKVDANQKEIAAVFRAVGISVRHTHMVGEGFPDLVIGLPEKNVLIAVKNEAQQPKDRRLTPAQVEFHDSWKGPIAVIESPEQAIALIQILRETGK